MLAGSPPSAMHHRHRLAALRHLAPVRRAHLVALPVHRERVRARAPARDTSRRCGCRASGSRRDHHRQRDVRAAVLGPACEDRESGRDRRRRPRSTTSWHGGRPPVIRGGNFAISASLRQHRQLAEQAFGHLEFEQLGDPLADLVERSTPSASAMRRIEPNRLIATGIRATRVPSSSDRRARTAAPARRPGSSCTRSAISVISSSTRDRLRDADQLAGRVDRVDELGRVSRFIDVASPDVERRRSRRSAALDSATSRKPAAAHPRGERRRAREIRAPTLAGRCRRPYVSMTSAADDRQHVMEVEHVERAHGAERGVRELEDHEARAAA